MLWTESLKDWRSVHDHSYSYKPIFFQQRHLANTNPNKFSYCSFSNRMPTWMQVVEHQK